jgi:hypothetical protein
VVGRGGDVWAEKGRVGRGGGRTIDTGFKAGEGGEGHCRGPREQ